MEDADGLPRQETVDLQLLASDAQPSPLRGSPLTAQDGAASGAWSTR